MNNDEDDDQLDKKAITHLTKLRIWQIANKEKLHAQHRVNVKRYNASQKGKDAKKAWELAHKDYAHAYYLAHKETIAARARAWYLARKKAKAKEDRDAG